MGLTQKYKQQQQQVRVLTNESNFVKGMYYTDVPLAEGYSKTLINFDIDSMSGKLTPRKGLQTIGLVRPDQTAKSFLTNSVGYNIVAKSKVCAASDAQDPRKINRYLQSILYNTETKTLLATTSNAEAQADSTNTFRASTFSINAADTFITPEPFVIANPGVHGKNCIHNNFFKKPVGTFAYGNSYYTFLRRNVYSVEKLAELPNDTYLNNDGEVISDYADLLNNSNYATGIPGQYFIFVSGNSAGVIAYYDTDHNLQIWTGSEDALLRTEFPDTESNPILCYTKLGSDIQADETLLDETIHNLEPDKYYICVAKPEQINPTEASSWGYNMLLKDPYNFICEETAVNMVTILGVLPYNKEGKIALTPRKNQEITLKGYYRAPQQYHSDLQNPKFYATTKKKITVTETVNQLKMNGDYYIYIDSNNVMHNIIYGYVILSEQSATIQRYYYEDSNGKTIIVDKEDLETEEVTVTTERDPKTLAELKASLQGLSEHDGWTEITLNEGVLRYNFGDWWYCTEEDTYYMAIPRNSLIVQELGEFGKTKPAASEKLQIMNENAENEIRIHWQMRSMGAATWTDLYNEVTTLSEYYARQGAYAPFTITTTLPESEVLIKLTITDVSDVADGEEYILSTNTIGLSTVSDELANTLNIDSKSFDLSQCTGMCEWEQRLVLWGVPGALNTLFVSEINNPTFFPYPNNIDIFTDPIIAVHNYGNELLVLTTSELYRLTWDTEGSGWSHKLVQRNLHVTEADTYMSCVIKNMFFFKSGEYYYMMVPKTVASNQVRGEVAIAPISKPIADLLDNFHETVYNLIKVMVDQQGLADFTDKLVNYFSYVDNTKVVVNYVYALDNTTAESVTQDITASKYLYVQLIYDTDIRTWSMRVFEAPHMLYASHADAIQQDRFIDLTPALNGDQLVLQYYKFINISDQTIQYITAEDAYQSTTKIIKNYQYLDTGNREINTELKKRFREFQFKLKNNTATNLGFYTSFLVDGSLRKDLQRYTPRFILDPSTNENIIVVERTLDPTDMTYKTTRIERVLIPESMLQDEGELTPTILSEEEDPDRWILNQSAFPGRTLCKIRMPISGKGLSPRAILLSTNEADYEILGDAWVYRTMNGK